MAPSGEVATPVPNSRKWTHPCHRGETKSRHAMFCQRDKLLLPNMLAPPCSRGPGHAIERTKSELLLAGSSNERRRARTDPIWSASPQRSAECIRNTYIRDLCRSRWTHYPDCEGYLRRAGRSGHARLVRKASASRGCYRPRIRRSPVCVGRRDSQWVRLLRLRPVRLSEARGSAASDFAPDGARGSACLHGDRSTSRGRPDALSRSGRRHQSRRIVCRPQPHPALVIEWQRSWI